MKSCTLIKKINANRGKNKNVLTKTKTENNYELQKTNATMNAV